MSDKSRTKYFIPLESDPDVFTRYIRNLGVQSLTFHDVLSLDDSELLSFVPRPVIALVLVVPTTPKYQARISEEEAKREVYTGSGEGEDVIWFKQTIGNACGLYGILHAVCNGEARNYIEPGSLLSKLLETCTPLAPKERALALEASTELEAAHIVAGNEGQTEAPAPEANVDYHYTCFVKSHKNGRLYELNGDLKGPIDLGVVEGDLLSDKVLGRVKEFVQVEVEGNIGFNLMALSKDGA